MICIISFILQCKVTDNGRITINSVADDKDKAWNSYMTSSISVEVVQGFKKENTPSKGVTIYTSNSEYSDDVEEPKIISFNNS